MDVFVIPNKLSDDEKREYYAREYPRLAAIATGRLIDSLTSLSEQCAEASDAIQNFADAQPKKIAGLQL